MDRWSVHCVHKRNDFSHSLCNTKSSMGLRLEDNISYIRNPVFLTHMEAHFSFSFLVVNCIPFHPYINSKRLLVLMKFQWFFFSMTQDDLRNPTVLKKCLGSIMSCLSFVDKLLCCSIRNKCCRDIIIINISIKVNLVGRIWKSDIRWVQRLSTNHSCTRKRAEGDILKPCKVIFPCFG